ncbi:MAG: hypothetical protein ACFCUN_07325 [Hyphomicrobiaceae bacterium]
MVIRWRRALGNPLAFGAGSVALLALFVTVSVLGPGPGGLTGGASAQARSAGKPAAAPSERDDLKAATEALAEGRYDAALPVLQRVYEGGSARERVFAMYYLALTFERANTGFTNPAKAYQLFQDLIAQYHGRVDPGFTLHAVLLSRAMISVARYYLNGLPELGVDADPIAALRYLNTAGTVYRDQNAQLAAARLILSGRIPQPNTDLAIRMLRQLALSGNVPAKAEFALLMWRGTHQQVPLDRASALALMSSAWRYAPASDELWIGDRYQEMYCAASVDLVEAARGVLASDTHPMRLDTDRARRAFGLGGVSALPRGPQRTCQGGQAVRLLRAVDEAQENGLVDEGFASASNMSGASMGGAEAAMGHPHRRPEALATGRGLGIAGHEDGAKALSGRSAIGGLGYCTGRGNIRAKLEQWQRSQP